MNKQSAGILLYRKNDAVLEILLVHPGGPFYKSKDLGTWSIPKGEFVNGEEALAAAKREFEEETGQPIDGDFIELQPVILKSGKKIFAWAIEGDIDHHAIKSNLFEMEWPPKSGKKRSFPEVDRAGWFAPDEARLKINEGQAGLIDELVKTLKHA